MQPTVSIITISFNSHSHTHELMANLDAHPQGELFELIVVDNGSKDPFEMVAQPKNYPVKVIHSPDNLGFSGGNNLGIPESQGAFLFFLNNDTLLEDNVLSKLVATLRQNKKAVMVSPKICFTHSDEKIQYAGCTAIDPIFGRGFAIGHMEEDFGQYSHEQTTGRIHGAAMLISKEAYEDKGKMYDPFFLYYEEMDFNQRIINAGGEVWFNGFAKVLHKESASIGRQSPLKTYYLFRNRMWFMWRNFSFKHNLLFSIYCCCIVFPKALLMAIKNKSIAELGSVIKGFIHGWRVA